MDERWKGCARTGSITIVQRRETDGSGERKVIVGLAKPFYSQRVKNMAQSVTKKRKNCRGFDRERRGRVCIASTKGCSFVTVRLLTAPY